MSHYNTIMHQLLTLIPRHHFEKQVLALDTDKYVKTFTTWNQFSTMLYAQASGKQSLRDIQNGLAAQGSRMYHLGLSNSVKRSTLAQANKKRDYRVFERLFYNLLDRCKSITPKHKFKFKNPLYAFDATTINLCLESFPWAKFRAAKGALKLHCQLDYSGNLPCFVAATNGKCHDLTVAKKFFNIVPDSIYCFDKGYMDFSWFRRIDINNAFFVTRAKENLKYGVVGQHDVPLRTGVLSDEHITLSSFYTLKEYPDKLRLIRYYDSETDKIFEFLTNNFKLAAETIARIYKARWQIEVFFKWIKQNLKIKTFLGTSINAVLIQVWTAMCYYLLLAYIKYQTRYKPSIFYLHRMVREMLMERGSLIDLLNLNEERLDRIKCQEQPYLFPV
ncbi:MAG: IS4 family transposase [Elusimicrobia bacterium]|nr:IS4 family transposase [Candidatus Omnitrophota bacterium]MCG2726812.1 IS4 family transposase [Elusimicrobiota bacterium]